MRPGCSIRLTAAQVLIAAAMGCAAGPALAAPAFGPPVDVAPADTQALEPSAAYDGAALLEIGWTSIDEEGDSLLATARRPLGGAFAPGPALDSGDGTRTGPVLATGPTGQIFAAWTEPSGGERGRVWASALDADGTPVGPVPISLATDDATEVSIAVGADGRPAIAWTVGDGEGNGEVLVVHAVLGLGLVSHVVSGELPNAGEPDVAFDAAGNLHVAFTAFNSDFEGRIHVGSETPAGTFGAPRAVAPADVVSNEPSIAPAAGGGLAIAWSETTGSSDTVQVGVETSPGAGVPTSAAPGGGVASGPSLATDPSSGALTLAWVREIGDETAALVGNRLPGGSIEAPVVVSGSDAVTALDLAYSVPGDAVITWQRNLGGEGDAGDIRAALFDRMREQPPPPPPVTPPPPPPPVTPPPPAAATVRPALTLTSFAVAPPCIRYGAPFTGTRKRLSFSFVLSEAATVRLAIQRRLNSGVQRVCPAVLARGAEGVLGPPVIVDVPSAGGPGATTVGDEGEAIGARAAAARPPRRLTVTRRLRAGRRRVVLRQAPTTFVPGTYVVTATATAPDGRRSSSPRVKFWVLRGAR